jgi:hypothetical protein
VGNYIAGGNAMSAIEVAGSKCSQCIFFLLDKEGSGTKYQFGGVTCAINRNQPYPLLLMPSNMQHTIVVDAEATFKESDWIGVNKKYQKVPLEVSDARDTLLQVPES